MSDTTSTASTTSAGNPVGWFEVGTDDPGTARAFYGRLFGWAFEEQGPYSIITTGPGHALQGGIQDTTAPLPSGQPRTYAIPCVEVGDVEATVRRAEDLGGKAQVPTTTPPSGPVYAMVADPAGNLIGVFSWPAAG